MLDRLAWPGRARRIEEGAALRRRLQMPLLAWSERGGQFRDRAQFFVRRSSQPPDAHDAKNTQSQKPPPSAIITVSQCCSDTASVMSPASTAHSIPLEYENAPTG